MKLKNNVNKFLPILITYKYYFNYLIKILENVDYDEKVNILISNIDIFKFLFLNKEFKQIINKYFFILLERFNLFYFNINLSLIGINSYILSNKSKYNLSINLFNKINIKRLIAEEDYRGNFRKYKIYSCNCNQCKNIYGSDPYTYWWRIGYHPKNPKCLIKYEKYNSFKKIKKNFLKINTKFKLKKPIFIY